MLSGLISILELNNNAVSKPEIIVKKKKKEQPWLMKIASLIKPFVTASPSL